VELSSNGIKNIHVDWYFQEEAQDVPF